SPRAAPRTHVLSAPHSLHPSGAGAQSPGWRGGAGIQRRRHTRLRQAETRARAPPPNECEAPERSRPGGGEERDVKSRDGEGPYPPEKTAPLKNRPHPAPTAQHQERYLQELCCSRRGGRHRRILREKRTPSGLFVGHA